MMLRQMNEIGNYNKPRTKFYWELNKNVTDFPLQVTGEDD